MDSTKLYLYALPVFMLAIVIEALYYRFVLDRPYQWVVTGANFVVAVGRLLTDLATKGLVLVVYFAAYALRPFDIPMDRWESWVALFFVVVAWALRAWACAVARPALRPLSSRRASTCPFLTRKPSSISTSVSVPVIWAETVAERRAVT